MARAYNKTPEGAIIIGDTLLGVVNAIAVIALTAITYWYARSTSRMLAQMKAQAEVTTQQADATQATVDLMTRAALPEWDMRVSFKPQEVLLNITNNGKSPGRNIQAKLVPSAPGKKKMVLHSDVPLANVVTPPGGNFLLRLMSEDPPYEDTLVIRSTGRWGVQAITRWHIRLHRRDYGHRELELLVLDRTTEFCNIKRVAAGYV